MICPISRALAMVMGLFLAANCVLRVARPELDATTWLIDLRWVNQWVAQGFLMAVGAALISFAARPRMRAWRWWGTLATCTAIGGVATIDWIRALTLSGGEGVQLGAVLAFSGCVLACIVAVALGVMRSGAARPARFGMPLAFGAAVASLGLFPLLQMATFGQTDYRRKADAILVFGARTYAGGRVSDALSDRMRTAIELYKQGHAQRMILSGGPGDGVVHEAEAMRRMAMEAGVPESALILDRKGINTRATVQNASEICRGLGIRSCLTVSHFYHLPRIKLEAQRAGLACYTVPSPQGNPLDRLPYFIAREAAACWAYYLLPAASSAGPRSGTAGR